MFVTHLLEQICSIFGMLLHFRQLRKRQCGHCYGALSLEAGYSKIISVYSKLENTKLVSVNCLAESRLPRSRYKQKGCRRQDAPVDKGKLDFNEFINQYIGHELL